MNKKRRLALIVNATESRTHNIKNELKRRGWETEEFHCMNWTRAFFGLKHFWKSVRRSQMVITGPGFPWECPWLLVARVAGRKVILDCPMDITIKPFPQVWHWKKMVGFFSRHADCFLTIASRGYLISKYKLNPRKVLFHENCPDAAQIKAASSSQSRFTQQPGTILLGYSGVSEWQRIERFVPIFKALCEREPAIRWLIISNLESPMIRELKLLAEKLKVAGAIHFLPLISPAEDFFATIGCCQLWIGHLGDDSLQGLCELRMELLELGLMGMPVVAVKTPALEANGFADGKNILFIDPDDVDSSADRLMHYLSQPSLLNQLADNLQAHVQQTFSLKHGVDRILAFVNEPSCSTIRPM